MVNAAIMEEYLDVLSRSKFRLKMEEIDEEIRLYREARY